MNGTTKLSWFLTILVLGTLSCSAPQSLTPAKTSSQPTGLASPTGLGYILLKLVFPENDVGSLTTKVIPSTTAAFEVRVTAPSPSPSSGASRDTCKNIK